MPKDQDQKVQQAISTILDEPEQIDRIAEIRGWFKPSGDNAFYRIIQSYLTGEFDLASAIDQITKPIDAEISAKSEDIDTSDLWYSILHSAKRISFRNTEDHQKLVNLVKEFKNHKGPAHEDESDVYSTLANFSMASRETMNDSPGYGAGCFAPEAHAWANLNYFFAYLTKDGVFKAWLYCIWAMRGALEVVIQDDEPNGLETAWTTSQKYDAFVPAAAVWVFALGKVLWKKEEDLTPQRQNAGNPAGGGQLWKGKAEFGKSRWAFWKSRFGEIGDMEVVGEETRKIAKEAVESMNESEKA